MKILVIDIGGSSIKFLLSGKKVPRKFSSGKKMTPEKMIERVLEMTSDWRFDKVTLGFPGPVIHGQPAQEPRNLGPGWVGFDFAGSFKTPVKVINDAAMQALGSYQGGRMLFIGLGTGVG